VVNKAPPADDDRTDARRRRETLGIQAMTREEYDRLSAELTRNITDDPIGRHTAGKRGTDRLYSQFAPPPPPRRPEGDGNHTNPQEEQE